MTANFPGPYGLRMFYTASTREHVQQLNIDLDQDAAPGDPFENLTVVTIAAQSPSLDAYVDAWVALMVPFYASATATIDYAELWKYDPGTYDATFISSYDIAEAGTAGGSTNIASEGIYTFRTTEGGVMKIVFEDTVTSPGASVPYASLGGSSADLVDFVLGDGGGFLGKDTSFPISFLKFHPGTNERNFKKVYRS